MSPNTPMRRLLFLVLLLATVSSFAEELKLSGSVRGRMERWAFFEPATGDPDSTFFALLLRTSVTQQVTPKLDWQVEIAAPMLFQLPDDAIAPAPAGQLGFGGSYYAANGDEDVASIFPKQAFVRYKGEHDWFRAGRFEFFDGGEVTPKNPIVAGLKTSRVAHRLIGTFGFSHVGRSADGLQYVHTTPAFNFTAVAFRPTVGAFNVDGLGELEDVTVLYGSATHSAASADSRVFVSRYVDDRAVTKTDNRPAAVRVADLHDVDVLTVGGHTLGVRGNFDYLAWGAWQTGSWGALDHGATAVTLEGGYHFAGTSKPVVRAGVWRSSGDDDAGDGDHGTFFQMLPTPRIYARFPFYNAMNSTDAFVQFAIKPNAKLSLTSEAHLLSLTESRDLWYSGGGAFEERSFGFAGRPANGQEGLARVVDLNVDYTLNPKTTLTLYGAFAAGDDVVDAIFTENNASFVYFEVTRKF